MNADEIQGNWKELKGKVKQQWSKLTDDDLTRASGKWDELTGLIQKSYGKGREDVEREIRKFREANNI